MKLYNEMKAAARDVMDAEENAAAWKKEAAERMKKVNNLIRAEEIASETKLDRKTVLEQLRAELTPAPEQSEPDTPANVVDANRNA